MVRMKKIAAAAMIAVAAIFSANAQEKAKEPIRYKIDANVGLGNYCLTNNSPLIDNCFKSHVNYRFSASVDIPVATNCFINTGVTFASKNSYFEHEFLNIGIKDGDVSIMNHYAQIPLNFGYRLKLGDGMGLSFMAGPYLAVAMKGKVSFEDRLGANRTFDLYKHYDAKAPSATELLKNPIVQQILQTPTAQQIMQDPNFQKFISDPRVQRLLSGQPFDNTDAIGQRFDVGIGGSIVFDVDRFYVQAGFEYGFLNTLNNDSWKEVKSLFTKNDKDLKLNNFSGYIGLGVKF